MSLLWAMMRRVLQFLIGTHLFCLAAGMSCANGYIEVPSDNPDVSVSTFLNNPKYGVLYDFTGGASFLNEDGTRNDVIIEFKDESDHSWYRIVDTIRAMSLVKECGARSITFVTLDDSCCHLTVMRLERKFSKDTVLTMCGQGAKNWLYGADRFSFKLSDSLLAYTETVRGGEDSLTERTTVLRLMSSTEQDTLAKLWNCYDPVFSLGSTELILNKSYATGKTQPSEATTVVIYDPIADSLIYPLEVEPGCNHRSGYRVSPDLPLFFLRYAPDSDRNIWRTDDSLGTVSVTDYRFPEFIKAYDLVGDTLVFQVWNLETQTFYYERLSVER